MILNKILTILQSYISIKSDKIILDNLVNGLYMRTNCLLSDFSFSECSTLSHLFNTYCMDINGSPLWKYYDKKLLELFDVAWKKSLRRVWNISNVTHIITYCLTFIIVIQLK